MLHAKFQDTRPLGSEKDFKAFSYYSPGGHLGHVTWTLYINLNFVPRPKDTPH